MPTDGEAPDLFLMDHDDLAQLSADKAIRRVDDLLAEREVDFGDGYTRNGLEAFSADAALQCMPLDISPMVVYYNPRLVELDQIAEPGSSPVTQKDGWSLDEFARRSGATTSSGSARPLGRSRPRAGRPVHLVRGRRGGRRHRRADDPHPLRRALGGRHGAAAGDRAQPGPDVQPEGAAQEVGVAAVQGRAARHAPGLPRPHPAAACRPDAHLRRDAAAAARQRRHDRADVGPVHLRELRARRGGRRPPRVADLRGRLLGPGRHRLRDAVEPRRPQQRRLPPARPAPAALRRLHPRAAPRPDAAEHDHLARRGRGGGLRAERAVLRPGDRPPAGAAGGDRRGVGPPVQPAGDADELSVGHAPDPAPQVSRPWGPSGGGSPARSSAR